ncbi:hypothetical protein V1460_16320 [Streptomyces sp. SCSIO 30461]|uniref:hypothetical protein n=1 Tax=Streptomyces sp. SCSIO 30461 TaxID=3118085 RepID=UPI0030CDEA66
MTPPLSPPDHWTADEQHMWRQYRRGEWCDATEVGAAAVRSLLLTAPAPETGQTARLHLRGARITGGLDLADVGVAVPVRMHRCGFESPLILRGARLDALVLIGCDLPGLAASGAATAREAKFVDCRVTGTLDLRSFTVGAWLSLDGSRLEALPGRPALDAQSLSVEQGMSASGLRCEGAVDLGSANIQEYLGFRAARLLGPEARLRAPELVVGGSLHLDRGFVNEGPINLYRASVGGSVHIEEATLTGRGTGRGQTALGLVCATVDGNLQGGEGVRVDGCIDLRDTQIRGTVNLDGAQLTHHDGPAIRAFRLQVEGDLHARRGLVAVGALEFSGARIGGSLLLEGAVLTGHDGMALRARNLVVGARIDCQNITARGSVWLSSAAVASRISFNGATISAPRNGDALILRRVTAPELALRLREAPTGCVHMSFAKFGVLWDDRTTWPRALVLDGLQYDALPGRVSAADRLSWLARDPAGFVPQPYEQLAAHYQRIGRDTDARTVLLAKHRRLRATLPAPQRLWGLLQDLVIGYGYLPRRAVWLLLLLLGLGSALFSAHHPKPVGDGPYPAFNAPLYTLDLLIPLTDLGQDRFYAADGPYQWLAFLLICSGWLLATVAATSANRVLRRN